MVFEHIEKLRREYADKYVVADQNRPELRRFGGLTGQVKTVNMNGRALVQFAGNNNVGWYDIEIDFLKVVDKPPPEGDENIAKPVVKKSAAAKGAQKEPSALEKARQADAKKKEDAKSASDAPSEQPPEPGSSTEG